MSDRIEYSEGGMRSIYNALTEMASDLGGTTDGLSAAEALMEDMPSLVCSISFYIVNPAFALASMINRTVETGTVMYALYSAKRQISSLQDSINELADRVKEAGDQFLKAELNLISRLISDGDTDALNEAMRLTAHFQSGGATDDPLDLKGQNGGDQALSKQRINHSAKNGIDPSYFDTYREIIRNNSGREFADDNELQAYLDEMYHIGCGYVCLINAIIGEYQDRPADFERDFGIQLYDGDDYNYDEILVDFYSTVNQPGIPVSDTADNVESMIETYFEAKNVPAPAVTIDNSILTAETYRNMVANGEVKSGDLFIGVGFPFTMRNADGTKVCGLEDASHGMTVIGTDGDYLLVSTWGDGETYRIDPSDYENEGFFWSCQFHF